MVYTVKELSKLARISIRTLHWYDQIDLLKPAYHGSNGYRFYGENELLRLQQILFFKELGFELKTIKELLMRSDFDQKLALIGHKKEIKRKIVKLNTLVKTIDNTLKHIKGDQRMNDQEMYVGFSENEQKDYQNYLINRFGQQAKEHIDECNQKLKTWKKDDFKKSQLQATDVFDKLANLWKQGLKADEDKVQKNIEAHYKWLLNYWTPSQEAYIQLGKGYTEFVWKKFFEKYDTKHPHFAQFIADAMEVYAHKCLA